jgi:ribose/xylose/arabinose/galactoside ABC-type transport system permease subunit
MVQPPYQVETEPGTTAHLDPSDPFGPPTPEWHPSRPERDRIWVHLLWEVLLAVGVVGVFLLARREHGAGFEGDGLRELALQAAVLGFLATGLAFSLRAAVPNLAVVAIAQAAAVGMARLVNESDWGYPAAISVVVAGAMAAGFALWIVVGGFHVPAWAASLGASVLITGLLFDSFDEPWTNLENNPDPANATLLWAGLFAGVSVVGGLVWLLPGVRRGFSGVRHEGDPARRPPPGGFFGSLFALVASSGLAAVAGVLGALRTGGAAPAGLEASTVFVVLAAVLIGGVSAFGRRGGVFGTVLGVALLSILQRWQVLSEASAGTFMVLVGGVILAGLMVTRLMEAAGRRRMHSHEG